MGSPSHLKNTIRASFTLPRPLLRSLSYVSLRLGVTKSELVASLLSQPVDQMRSILFQVPDPITELSAEDKARLFELYRQALDGAISEAQGLTHGQ